MDDNAVDDRKDLLSAPMLLNAGNEEEEKAFDKFIEAAKEFETAKSRYDSWLLGNPYRHRKEWSSAEEARASNEYFGALQQVKEPKLAAESKFKQAQAEVFSLFHRRICSHRVVQLFSTHSSKYFALFDDTVWSSAKFLLPQEWEVLIKNVVSRERKKIDALAGVSTELRREHIPEQVRVEVWRRDEGKCVRCGSRERLEFDHIIPVAMGGSTTARNIELLCERCNRCKGATLG